MDVSALQSGVLALPFLILRNGLPGERVHFLTALTSFQSWGQIVLAVVMGAGGARPAPLHSSVLQTVNKAVSTGAPVNPFAPLTGRVCTLQSNSWSPYDSL